MTIPFQSKDGNSKLLCRWKIYLALSECNLSAVKFYFVGFGYYFKKQYFKLNLSTFLFKLKDTNTYVEKISINSYSIEFPF